MLKIFFDIERYKPAREKDFINEKIIAIGYAIVKNLDRVVERIHDYPKITILTEWTHGSEYDIVRRFYNIILRENLNYKTIELIGFSILKFDIPILIQKVVDYKIAKLPVVNKKIFKDSIILDLHPISVLLNKMRLKGSSLDMTVDKIALDDEILPKINTRENGAIVHRLYEEGNYERIETHLINDVKKTIWLYKIITEKIAPHLPNFILNSQK